MTALRPYQLEVLDPLRSRFVYGDPPGTGKTATTLTWTERIEAHRVLIVAPKSVLGHWEREATVWRPDLDFYRGTGTKARREKVRSQMRRAPFRALLLNYETFRQDIAEIMAMPWDAVVFDEAHRLKNRNAQVHKAAVKMARRVQHLALVTGTPILNHAEEAWSLFHLLDPRAFSSFWRWAHEHFYVTQQQYGGRLAMPVRIVGDPKPGAHDAIRQELGSALVKRSLTSLLPDLPPVTEITNPVELSGPERKAYDSLAKHHGAENEGVRLMAPNQLAKMTRLRQLTSDWATLLDESNALGAKTTAALDLISDLDPERVVVFAAYRSTCLQLVEHLMRSGIPAVAYTGEMSAEERERALRLFVDGDAEVIVGTIGAMGEGVDGLQVAQHVVFIDRDWTPAINEQALGRVRRSGQGGNALFAHHIVASNTIDQYVAEVLARKEDTLPSVVPVTE